MNITLTDQAIAKIKDIYSQDQDLAGKALRVAIEAGGCSGYSYAFRFDAPADADLKRDFDGFTMVIDQKSNELLDGAVIDYKEEFGSEGFRIQNPNAKKSCGCGNSFDA